MIHPGFFSYGRLHRVLITMVVLFICSCFFNVDLPLKNDIPTCDSHSAINNVLIYPESSVCTLQIDDRNDDTLSITESACSIDSCDGRFSDSCNVISWPGTHRFLSSGYGTKLLQLLLDTNRMGIYCGKLRIEDNQNAAIEIPYTITKQFIDRFTTYPLSPSYWQPYHENDSVTIGYSHTENKLIFIFDPESDLPVTHLVTGIRSRFSIASSLSASVKFKLRNDMDEAFEISFFISTSPDTGRWLGEKAGIYLSGSCNRLQVDCRSTHLQQVSFATTVSSGEIGISRSDSTVRFFTGDGNSSIVPVIHATLFYPPETPVYIHLKMTVRDLEKTRNCYWYDFKISEGIIAIPSSYEQSSREDAIADSNSGRPASGSEQK